MRSTNSHRAPHWLTMLTLVGIGSLTIGCADFVLEGGGPAQPGPAPDPWNPQLVDGGAPAPDSGQPAPGNPAQPDQGAPLPPDQGAPAQPDSAPGPTGACGNAEESEVFKLVNAERQQRGLTPYSCHLAAGQVSRAYSKTMCLTGRFSHTGKDGSSPTDRIRAAGIGTPLGWAGENIAWGAQTPAGVMSMWMKSPGHRKAILSKSFTAIGIGYYPCTENNSYKRHYWTQNFL